VRHFLIDTDTASDDAVALVMALNYPDVEVEAITVVAGNVPLEMAVQNALYTVELCQRYVPVYRGADRPLLRTLGTAQDVHGIDGLGDIGLPLKGRTPAQGHAVPVIVNTINHFAGEIMLVTLGPLTNIALALRQDPSLAHKVKHCYIMGGIGQGYGNVTPVAEYNIWVDPEAAKIVFESGMPMTMVGWDISRLYATFNNEDALQLRSIGTPLAEFCLDIQSTVTRYAKEKTHLVGFDLPDPITMAVALEPAVATEVKRLHVTVETESELCRGQTVVDHIGLTGQLPNMDVVLAASREHFLKLLYDAVRGSSERRV
jgi:purine nucleosidase